MSVNFNQVLLIGNISNEIREIGAEDNPGVSFNVAVNSRYGGKERVDFVPVTAWKQNAEFAKNFLSKGRSVLVIGELRSRRNEENGVTYWNVNANKVQANDIPKKVQVNDNAEPVVAETATETELVQ